MPDPDQPQPASDLSPVAPVEPAAARDTISSLDLRPSRHEDPPWGAWDVILIVFVALLSILLFSVAGIVIAAHVGTLHKLSPLEIARDARIVVPVQLAAYAVVVAFMYLLVRRIHGRFFWEAVLWHWPAKGWAYLLGGVGLAVGIEVISSLLPIPKSLPIEHFFTTSTGAYLMGLFGISAAPLVEELFFRGFLYPVLVRRLGMLAGIVLTAGLFALIHGSQLGYAWGPVSLLFIVGLVLTITRARTRSVAPGFLVHVGYNLMLFVLLFISTDRFHHLEKMAGLLTLLH